MDELEDGLDTDKQNNSAEREEIKPIKRKGRPPKTKCKQEEGFSSPQVKAGLIGHYLFEYMY